MEKPGTIRHIAVVSNNRNMPAEVWFEPWGMNHMLAAGGSFNLDIESEIEGRIEIVESEDSIAIYSFPTPKVGVGRQNLLRISNGPHRVSSLQWSR